MAKKKASRPAARGPKKAIKKAARKPSGRAQAKKVLKKVARRAAGIKASATRKAGAALKKAVRQGAGVKAAATKKAQATIKKALRKGTVLKAAATKQVEAATKQIQAVATQASAQQKSAATAIGKAVVFAKAVTAGVTAALTPPAPRAKARPKHPPTLDRARKTVDDIHGVPSSLGAGSLASAAKSGRAELQHKLKKHTSSSPALTAGDVDADWESADSTGDEAPGGDNPTPDQDVVDEIGRALGVEYADDEELQGGDEIADRDRHRWELDPHSADDADEKDEKD